MKSFEILEAILNDMSDVKMLYIGSNIGEIYDELGYDAVYCGNIEPHSSYIMLEDKKFDEQPDAIAWDGSTTYLLYLVED